MIEERIEEILNKEIQTIRYLLVSTCLGRLLPSIPEVSYPDFYRAVLRNQMQAWEDQLHADPINCCVIKGDSHAPCKPSIFCSFHISSYRMGLKYLATQQIPISLVVSDDVLKEQHDIIQEVFMSASNGVPLEFIKASSPHSLISMIRALKCGRSLFVYVDGNTGSDGMSNTNANLTEIKFLSSSLLVRKGISTLSFLTKTPIVPLVTHRTQGGLEIEFYPVISPDGVLERDEYVEHSLKTLYSILERHIAMSPEAWEAWLYIHKFIPIPKEDDDMKEEDILQKESEGIFHFNSSRYRFYQHSQDGTTYLFDTNMLRAYPIDLDLSIVLHTSPISSSSIPRELLHNLIKQHIIL